MISKLVLRLSTTFSGPQIKINPMIARSSTNRCAAATTVVRSRTATSSKQRAPRIPISDLDEVFSANLSPEECFDKLQSARKSNLRPSHKAYNKVIHGYAKRGKKGDAEFSKSLLDLMWREERWKPDVYSFSSVINGFSKAGDVNAAVDILDRLVAAKIDPNIVCLNGILKAFAKAGDGVGAGHFLETKFKQHDVIPNSVSFNTVLHSCAKQGDSESAMFWLEKMLASNIAADIFSWNSVLDSFGKSGNADGAVKIFSRMMEQKINPDVMSVNSCLAAFSKESNIESAKAFLKKAKAKNISPNVVSYNTLMSCYQKDPDSGASVLKKMVDEQIRPTEISFAILIHLYSVNGQIQKAGEWLLKMKDEYSISPNEIHFNNVIDAAAKAGDTKSANFWMHRMMEAGLRVTGVGLNSAMSSYAVNSKQGDVFEADENIIVNNDKNNHDISGDIARNMLENNSLPYRHQPSTTEDRKVHGLVKKLEREILESKKLNDPRKAEIVLSRFLESYPHVQVNAKPFNLVMSALSKDGLSHKTVGWLERMKSINVRPDVYSFCSCLHSYSRNGDVVNSIKIFDEMVSAVNVEPSTIAYSTLIAACSKKGELDLAEKYFKLMETNQVDPNAALFTSLLHCCARLGQYSKAIHYLDQMDLYKVEQATRHFNCVLDAYLKGITQDNLDFVSDSAMILFDKIKNPDLLSFNVMLTILSKNGSVDKAIDVFNRMTKFTSPDIVSFNCVISAHAHLNNSSGKADSLGAMQWLKKVGAFNLQPNVISFQNVLKSFAINGEKEEAANLIHAMKNEYSVLPDIGVFNCLVNLYARLNDFAMIEETLKRMEENKMTFPNQVTYDSILFQASNRGDVKKVRFFFDRMANLNRIKPTSASFISVLHVHAKHNDKTELLFWIVEMQDRFKVTPSVEHLNCILDGASDTTNASYWFWYFANHLKIQPNLRSYNIILKNCVVAKNVPEANHFFQRLLNNGIKPDRWTYNHLIDLHAETDDPSNSLACFRDLEKAGIDPNELSFQSLIKAYSRVGDSTNANFWVAEMKRCGFDLKMNVFNDVIRSHQKYEDLDYDF